MEKTRWPDTSICGKCWALDGAICIIAHLQGGSTDYAGLYRQFVKRAEEAIDKPPIPRSCPNEYKPGSVVIIELGTLLPRGKGS